MGFLEPSALVWASVLAGVAALYLFRRRPRKLLVSALAFYKSLSAAHQESAWMRFLKKLIALLLSVGLVACSVAWLARLTFSPGETDAKTVILLVDRSASMSARTTPAEPTRLASGMQLLRQRLTGLPDRTGIAVIAYDARPEILLGRSNDRHAITAVLDQIRPQPIAGDPERALALAQALAIADAPAVIWHLTDSPAKAPQTDAPSKPEPDSTSPAAANSAPANPAGSNTPLPVAPNTSAIHVVDASRASSQPATVVSIIPPHAPGKNAGITAFHLRRLPLETDRYEAFIQIEGVAPEPEDAELEIRMNDRLAGLRKVPIKTGGRERIVLPFAAAECSRLRLTLRLPGDMLAADDALSVPVPGSWPVHVLWVSPTQEPYTELALRSLATAGMEVQYAKPADWPPKQLPDVVLFEGMAPPAEAPRCPVILLNPTASYRSFSIAPLKDGGVPLERLRVTDAAHPILYGVANERLLLTQTAALPAQTALEPLWIGPAGALLCAGEMEGQRTVVMAFSPLSSERLALTASYPLLLGNAIYWTTEHARHAVEGRHLKTGELLPITGATLDWTDVIIPSSSPAGANAAATAAGGTGGWLTLNGIGAWKTSDGRIGSAGLLSSAETNLSAEAAEAQEASTVSVWPGPGRLLLWLVLGLLCIEFWLFHRHAVY